MIQGETYVEMVTKYFGFLAIEFNLVLTEITTNGNYFYQLRYANAEKAVTIAYENIEDYLTVYVSLLQSGRLPNYDNKTKTLHLNRLDKEIIPNLSKKEIDLNNKLFSGFKTTNVLERKILKSAKDLRLCFKYV